MNVNTVQDILNTAPPWAIVATYVMIGVPALLILRSLIRSTVAELRKLGAGDVDGTHFFYAAALVGMAVSIDTSWNYFGEILHIDNLWARSVTFFALEIAQIACGWGMRASIRKHGTPGATRWVAWALCAVSAYMACQLSGVFVAVVRVTLGPILSLVMLHLALGIEMRGLKVRKDSMWVRLAREFRERFLAMFGLGDENRDAKTIAQDRALNKAIEIRMRDVNADARTRRFVQQLAKAGIMDSPEKMDQFIQRMQLAANAKDVYDRKYDMLPGLAAATSETVDAEIVETGPETAQVSDGETTETARTETVSLTPRGDQAQAEIETLLQVMRERGGADMVSLNQAIELIGRSKATTDRRLRAARERFTQAS